MPALWASINTGGPRHDAQLPRTDDWWRAHCTFRDLRGRRHCDFCWPASLPPSRRLRSRLQQPAGRGTEPLRPDPRTVNRAALKEVSMLSPDSITHDRTTPNVAKPDPGEAERSVLQVVPPA